jgi:hypothetical protein
LTTAGEPSARTTFQMRLEKVSAIISAPPIFQRSGKEGVRIRN